jgi:phospholipase/lecithinase/hemolysin
MKIKLLPICGALLALFIIAGPVPARASGASGAAGAAEAPERLVVFGDSLSDPGNFFAIYRQVSLPPYAPVPDAPYAIGGHHYSNGATWVERLGRALHARESTGPAMREPGDASNYAVGRARARPGAPVFPYYDLSTQVGLYLAQTGNHASGEALYVIWIGANDLKDALESLGVDPSFVTAAGIIHQAVGMTAANVQALWAAGARHFLIADMPDLGITPYLIGLGPMAQYVAGQLTGAYNSGLGQAEAALGVLPGVRITRFDVNAVLNSAEADPAAAGFQVLDTPCLRFGVTVQAVCPDPEHYLFWDAIHPTAAGHQLLADAAYATLAVQ